MKKRNTIIALICTLVIGLILGFFTAGRLAKNRMDKVRKRMERPRAEQEFIYEQLSITDEQKTLIKPILDSMLPIQMELRRTHRQEMIKERKAMFQAIMPHLTPAQIKEHKRLQANRPKNMEHRPPPPRH